MNEFFYHDNADPNQKSREAGFLNERPRECAYSWRHSKKCRMLTLFSSKSSIDYSD